MKKTKLAVAARTTLILHLAILTPLASAITPAAGADVQLHGDAAALSEPELESAAAMVLDRDSGRILYARNADLTHPIASITKLMTALVILDSKLPLDKRVVIGRQDVDRLKHTRSRLPLGTVLTRRQLLHMAVIASENRAAAALARSYPGGTKSFVRAMNRKARELGMAATHFADGTGLSAENRSCAEDLVKLVESAYQYPLIRQISSTPHYVVSLDKKGRRKLAYRNTNRLVADGNWRIGVSKTGFINESGHCLVMEAEIAESRVIIVLLDAWSSGSRVADASRIRQWLERGSGDVQADGFAEEKAEVSGFGG